MEEEGRKLLRFGCCELIPSAWILRREGDEVPDLPSQDFKLLCCLVENAPEIVTREQLLTMVGWKQHGQVKYLEKSISNLRKILGSKSSIRYIRDEGYKLTLEVTRETLTGRSQSPHPSSNFVSRKPQSKDYEDGHFSALGTLHVHIDGERERATIDRLVRHFEKYGNDSKKSIVVDRAPGPQRNEEEFRKLYQGHTPGVEREELDYFSTHLFLTYANTKRQLKELLKRIKDTKGIVIEAERILQTISHTNINEATETWLGEYPPLTSGDVGYQQWHTDFGNDLVEVHWACDIRQNPKDHNPPFKCEELVRLTSSIGIEVGGWFRFEKPNWWAYRSNMFARDVPEIEGHTERLRSKLAEIGSKRGFECEVQALVEQSLGVWKTPLSECDELRSIFELSEWEGKYPNLTEFWVVTSNFLGDKKDDIKDAMIRNLSRGVTYTYFLRSVADYMRLQSFAKDLEDKIDEHVDVRKKIRGIMVLEDLSTKETFDEVFDYKNFHGCFIANPLTGEGTFCEDSDGYELIRSSEPGDICGGRVMEFERLKRIVNLLQPLTIEHPLQGLSMSRPSQRKTRVAPTPSVVCVEFRGRHESLAQLMSQVENETVSRQVEGYDLLIATEVSRRGGQVIRSIEPGYLLAFNQQSAALKCAEQIRTKFKKQFNSDFALRIAIDRGDVWRLIRAHGTEYCGPTVTSCRELLKETQDGEIATTESFARSLAREDRELGARMRQQIERTFKFDGISQPIWALSC